MILAINTASSTTELALIKEDQVLSYRSWKSSNNEASTLLPTLSEMLTENNLTFHNIEEILVIKGPGSFTGLRIGITVANTIGYLLKNPIKTLTTFQYWWLLKELSQNQDQAILAIFAGKQGVYLSKNNDSSGQLFSLEEALEKLSQTNSHKIFGDITPEQKDFFQTHQFIDIMPSLDKIALNLKKIPKISTTDIVKPLYIKSPGITLPKPL